jgi:hypothetical protein
VATGWRASPDVVIANAAVAATTVPTVTRARRKMLELMIVKPPELRVNGRSKDDHGPLALEGAGMTIFS